MPKHTGVYPGTFDPITKGHLDIIGRGLKLFDTLIVAVAENSTKKTLFSADERLSMIKEELKGFNEKSTALRAEVFDCLLIDYMKKRRSGTVLRGLRVISDFEYEFQMALTNRKLAPDIETVFMMTSENYAHVSSRFIKDIARLGGDLSSFVTPVVAKGLKRKFSSQGI